MPEAERESVRRLILETWGKGDLSLLEALLDDQVLVHYGALPEPLVGVNAYREFLGAYQALLGRVTFSVEDQLEDGDKVVTRWTVRANDAPDEPGAMGISIHRFADGRIAESWVTWDTVSAEDMDGPTDVLSEVGVTI